MKLTQKVLMMVMIMTLGFSLVSLRSYQQQAQPKPWDVPAEFKNKKNPVASNPASINLGSSLYKKNCASCHGKEGKGDGVKARTLKTFPGDFSKGDYQKQTDGELFYKTKTGRGDMPSYDKKVPDNDIWNIVNYLRTLKK
jgi:mono/diheme cytochrome c family protein